MKYYPVYCQIYMGDKNQERMRLFELSFYSTENKPFYAECPGDHYYILPNGSAKLRFDNWKKDKGK